MGEYDEMALYADIFSFFFFWFFLEGLRRSSEAI